MADRDLRLALRRPGGVGAFWFALGSPSLVEVSLAAGPALVVLDQQHGLWSRDGLEDVLGRIPPGIPTLARLPDGSAREIGQALDAGATGVLVPLVESAAATAACIRAAHFPPRGCRSGGGVRPLGHDFPAYVARARARTVVGVMIETAAGVAEAAAIAAVPGLDVVFIGTGDLALSLDCFPAVDERHEAACRHVLAACRAAGVPCGRFTASAEDAARRAAEGYALTVAANDIGLVSAGFRAAQAAFASQSEPRA